MSGVLKGIGKVFKKVARTVIKIAPYALAAAAVVFTGGAALGVLPTFGAAVGSVVGGLGLSGAVGGALTGAITSAGFGAAVGGVLGGKKGLKQGALMGALTGGAIGALSPATFGAGPAVAKGADIAARVPLGIESAGSLTPSITGIPSASGGLLQAGTAAATAPVAGSVGSTVLSATAPAAVPASGGALGFLNSNPMLASQLLGGVSQAFAPNEYKQRSKAEQEQFERQSGFAYGGAYSGQTDPFGVRDLGQPPAVQPGNYYTPRPKRWQYDPATNKVVEVEVG
jgi:hypothetical protein